MIARPQTNHLNPTIINFGIGFIFIIIGALLALTISSDESFYGTLSIIAPIVLGVMIIIFSNPYYGILLYLNYSFISNGISRYAPENVTIVLNFILLLTTLSLVVHLKWDDFKKLSQSVFYITIIWAIYSVISVVNSYTGQVDTLFVAVQGISFYAIQLVPLALIYFNTKKDFNTFLKIIIGWSVLSTIWAFKQTIFGTDFYEEKWLDAGAYVSHILNGQLRAFSTFSDAGQFGLTMAFISFVCLVLSFGPNNTLIKKFSLIAISIFTFLGFLISGTNVPLYVFIVGFIFFFILIKQFKTLIFGLIFGVILFLFLKFSTISNFNFQEFEIGTSLTSNDASLMVSSNNQFFLTNYIEKKSIDNGIVNFNLLEIQNYFASIFSNFTSFSWYIKMWNQSGIIGLLLHILGISYVLIIGFIKINKLKSNELRYKVIAIYVGFIIVIFTGFANHIFNQIPLGPIMYICMVYLSSSDKLDLEFSDQETQNKINSSQSNLAA
jgi:hypothetical protein